MKKIIFTSLVVLLIAAASIYFYTYKEHRDISLEKADFSSSTQALRQEFTINDSLFNVKYADKTIEIYGKTSNIDLINKTIVIDANTVVVFRDAFLKSVRIEQEIKIKGRYVGYDDLLDEFKIDQAIIVD